MAVSKNGNNQIFHIAWAIVDLETKVTLKWFIRVLKYDLKFKKWRQAKNGH